MRAFDWRRLFAEQRIPYIDTGANVKRGEINIRCPWCGSADPSQHMGINLETGWYSCWRNRAQHSGKSPLRLIIKLLGIPYGRAREIAGLSDDYVDPEGFDALAARLMNRDKTAGRKEDTKRRVLDLDEDFVVIGERGRTRFHHNYLVNVRGFIQPGDIERLGKEYGICAGVGGAWSSRIVLPYYQDGELMTWTARAISDSTMRYRDLDRDESICPPKETLYNHDCMLTPARVLLVVEGPLDALKLDFYGKRHGVRAVGLSTNSATEEQAFLLQTAVGRIEKTLVMMDATPGGYGVVDSMRMKETLNFLPNLGFVKVPHGAKDGADLTPGEIDRWVQTL